MAARGADAILPASPASPRDRNVGVFAAESLWRPSTPRFWVASLAMTPAYSLCIPTYNRPDTLDSCLEHVERFEFPLDQIQVLVIDNGRGAETAAVAKKHAQRLSLEHLVNDVNRGLGYSLNRGFRAARGQRVVSLNDDAMMPPHFLRQLDAVFDVDPKIGCIGVRALEEHYAREFEGIGVIDDQGNVVGNFDIDCGRRIDVDHVYGFCYAFTREALEAVGVNDQTLLAKPYSTGDRIETDHCMRIKEAGYRVVYDPAITVRHLALPRADMPERTLKWKLNSTRNTLYLFLKHYGVFGRKALALRYALLHDVGIISAIRQPTRFNWAYFLTGARARASAVGHYMLYLLRGSSADRLTH